MLTLQKVQEVKTLIDEGNLSQRKIAEQTGVSRHMVSRIKNGDRGVWGRDERAVELKVRSLREMEGLVEYSQQALQRKREAEQGEGPVAVAVSPEVDTASSKDPQRCPGCGGLVYMPCVLCAVQNSQGSPNCNIELVEPEEVFELVRATTAATGVAEAWKDLVLEERWTVAQ